MNLTESRALASRLASLLRQEQHAMADFLVALADFHRRRGWVELGYSGLFPFLHKELGLSKAAAFFRMTAAELIQRFPEIVEPLRDGRLCLTTMASLAKVLTPENRAEVLPRFFHRSKQEAAVIAAEFRPVASPPTRNVVTTVAAPGTAAAQLGQDSGGTDRVRPAKPPCPEGTKEPQAAAPSLPDPVRPMAVEPLTASQARLHMTVSPEFLAKLEAARLALSHSLPGASAEDVLSAGLDLLLERDARRKGQVERPRPAPPEDRAEPGAVHIPAAVRREVWRRDQGCCQWPVSSGGVCGSRVRVQFDHRIPRVDGGPPTTLNVRLLCSVHNRLAARERLGDRLMDRYCRDPRHGELGVTAAPCPPAAEPGPSPLAP